MSDKLKEIIQTESNREAKRILDQVNADPTLQDVHAPEEIHDALFAQIEEYEKSRAYTNLSEEDQELIKLGKKYKRNRKWSKHIAAAAVFVFMISFGGITAVGGPEKVMEVVQRLVMGRDQTVVNVDEERTESVKSVSEEEAYEKIEEEFGFSPVRMHYLPEGMEFQDSGIYKDSQYVYINYMGEKNSSLIYVIHPNYRVSSMGNDIEDTLLEEFIKEQNGTTIFIKKYKVEENDTYRWAIEFEYQDVFYFIQMLDWELEDVNKVIENLYFS